MVVSFIQLISNRVLKQLTNKIKIEVNDLNMRRLRYLAC